MWDILLLLSIFSTAVVGAPDTFTGHRGENVSIRCPYEYGYKTNSKYLCKGECSNLPIIGSKVIMVESGSPAEDERFSLTDDTISRVFTVTITDLRTDDGGKYWCAVRRIYPLTDVYTEVLLQVNLDNETTEAATVSTLQATSSSSTGGFNTDEVNEQSTNTPVTDTHASDGHVLNISVGLIITVIVFLLVMMLFLRQRKSKKSPRVAQSASQHVSVWERSNTREDVNEEDCDDHKYEEIGELQNMREHISTIYTTADSPEDSAIYYTAYKEDSIIYSTADEPQTSTIYCTVDKPEEPVIYSTADKPDSMYVIAGKPL